MTSLINYLSDIITDFFIENKIISSDERAVYKYGTEVTVSTLTGIVLILFIGGVFGNILDSVLFLLCFITVRVYSGGYHANTYIKCNLTFVSVFILVMLVNRVISENFSFIILLTLLTISLVVIAVFAPIENEHKPLYGAEKKKYKKISIAASILWSIVSIGLFLSIKKADISGLI